MHKVFILRDRLLNDPLDMTRNSLQKSDLCDRTSAFESVLEILETSAIQRRLQGSIAEGFFGSTIIYVLKLHFGTTRTGTQKL